MDKILVTGGFGYVGSRLAPHLLELGYDLRVIDLLLYSSEGLDSLKATDGYSRWESKFDFIQGDIRNPVDVDRALNGIDIVIHLAAISNDPTGEVDEVMTRQVNFDAVGMLIAKAKKAGVRRFINASSSSVFGIKEDPKVTEILEPEPLTYYSKYKALSEWLVLAASSEDFCSVNIRPATICGYSPRQRFDLTVNKLTIDAVSSGKITVHGGEQRRPNVGISDMINLYGNLVAVDQDLINGRTFNFGFENHKVIEIAETIKDVLSDLDVSIEVTETSDKRDYHISSAKITDTIGYNPVSSIRNEVTQLRQAYEEGRYDDIKSSSYYNMESMHMKQHAGSYEFLSK